MVFYGKYLFPYDGWVEESIQLDCEENSQRENEEHFNSRKHFDYRYVSNDLEYFNQNGLKEFTSSIIIETPNNMFFKPGDKVVLKSGVYFISCVSSIDSPNIGYAVSIFGENAVHDNRVYKIEMEAFE